MAIEVALLRDGLTFGLRIRGDYGPGCFEGETATV